MNVAVQQSLTLLWLTPSIAGIFCGPLPSGGLERVRDGMFKAVLFQLIATLFGAALAAALFGVQGAYSAAAGGLACVLPNALFALKLAATGGRAPASYPAAFFVGEFIKVAAIVGLLALAAMTIEGLHWGALLIGMVLALKANLFAFWVKT